MSRNRMIIVEGPQGTGKSTLTNYLRDNIPSSNLQRLSGQRDKTINGKVLSEKMYFILLNYLKAMESIPMDFVFDRNFFSEEVYARLGYKEYSFTDVYNSLIDKLCALDYDIYLILLFVQNKEVFYERLKREHHSYQSFSIENSMNQQKCYLELGEELKNTNIKVIPIATDDFSLAYNKINELLSINVQADSNDLEKQKIKR